MTDQWLTQHFKLSEFTTSEYAIRHGLDNTPDSNVLSNILVCADGLERVRTILAVPIHIQSGYRSQKVNAGVGGARASQHLTGGAADIVVSGVDAKDVCEFILDHEDYIDFDQLILEAGWTHISFVNDRPPRRDVLTAHFGGGVVTYTKGIS